MSNGCVHPLRSAGVATALGIIRKELDVAMALTGTRCLQQIARQVLAD